MNLLYYIIFSLGIFLCTLIGYKKYFSIVVNAIAVGGVVNSNYWSCMTTPIDIFGFDFGIDAVIYTLYIYCIILMYFRKGKKDAYLMGISGTIAVILASIFEVSAKDLSGGYESIELILIFVRFVISATSSLLLIIPMIKIIDILKEKHNVNNFLLIIIGIVFVSVFNTFLHLGLTWFTYVPILSIEVVLLNIATSLMGRLIGLGCALIAFLVAFLLDKYLFEKKEKANQEPANLEENKK